MPDPDPATAPPGTPQTPPRGPELPDGPSPIAAERVTDSPASTGPVEPAPATPVVEMAPAASAPVTFAQWLTDFQTEAAARGISRDLLAGAFNNLVPRQEVLRRDGSQSEYNQTFFQYLNNSVSPARIERGRSMLRRHAARLNGIAGRYGVPDRVLVALWATESDFGAYTGDFSVIQSLATLAHGGRRREFFRTELMAALTIAEQGRAQLSQLKGSWAGAMGQPQFMPSTYLRYARDGDGDGDADIWGNAADVLESAANYLNQLGWQAGLPWGQEVLLPDGFDYYETDLAIRRPLAEWARRGVRGIDARPLPQSDLPGSILLPSGQHGPAFLVYDNFRVIMQWNRSLHYGLAVGHLADRLAGGGPLLGRAPPGDQALSRRAIMDLQRHLGALGLPVGAPDGMVGEQTRSAVREYQKARGITPDAYPTPPLLALIAQEARDPADLPTEVPAPQPSTEPAADLRTIQVHLNRLGFAVGTPNGQLSARTRSAITAYQRQQGLPVTGAPSPGLAAQLARDIGERVRASGGPGSNTERPGARGPDPLTRPHRSAHPDRSP